MDRRNARPRGSRFFSPRATTPTVRTFGSSWYRSAGSLLPDQPSRWDSCTRRTASLEVVLQVEARMEHHRSTDPGGATFTTRLMRARGTVLSSGGRSVSSMVRPESSHSSAVVPGGDEGTGLGGQTSPVVLSDDAVVLRPWTCSDAAFMAEASRDPRIERYNGPVPASVAEAVAVIERIEQSWRTFDLGGDPTGAAFVIVDAALGEPVGMCGIDHWSRTDVAQFGYWLAAGARGRGLATRAATLMTGWLFELGAARVVLTIHSDNSASAAVARRAGFAPEGTLRDDDVWAGQRKDVDVFAALSHEWPLSGTL